RTDCGAGSKDKVDCDRLVLDQVRIEMQFPIVLIAHYHVRYGDFRWPGILLASRDNVEQKQDQKWKQAFPHGCSFTDFPVSVGRRPPEASRRSAARWRAPSSNSARWL